ncbi:hypothetical protein AB1N83_001628 [Pleurotus pulmonarius]
MSPSGPNQPTQAAAPSGSSQNNDTKKQNEKIFHLFLKKLASPNPPTYTEACRKLAQWLNDSRAYYPEALSWILRLLHKAQKTLSDQPGVVAQSPFHVSLAANSPLASEYRDLVNTVAKYRSQFVNTEFLPHLDGFCKSIDDRFAVTAAETQPSSTSTIAPANPPAAPPIATTRSNPPPSAPAAQAAPLNVAQSTAAAPATNHIPTPHVGVAVAESAGRADRGGGVGEAGGLVQGARMIAAKHSPISPPVPSTSSTVNNTKPAPNATHRAAPAPAFTPAPAPIVNPTPNAQAAPSARASTVHPNAMAPALAPNPNAPAPNPNSNTASVVTKAGGVKLRRRNMPRADILDADDEDARRRLEAAKLGGITVERRPGAGRRGSGNGRGGAATGAGAGRRGSGSSAGTMKSPSVPTPAFATNAASATVPAGVKEQTLEAARPLVKAEITDERTPGSAVSQGSEVGGGPGERLGSASGIDLQEREASTPLRAEYDRRREQGLVPLKTEPSVAPSTVLQTDSVPQRRSPQPLPEVEVAPSDGERQRSHSGLRENAESEGAEPARAPQVEALPESTAAPPEHIASERDESVPTPRVEEQPISAENKIATTETEALSEPPEELPQPPRAEAEAEANADPVESHKVAENGGLKSPLSTTESRASTSTPFAPRFQLSQAVFTSPSSISVSPERGAPIQDDSPLPVHTVGPPTDSALAIDAAPTDTASVALPLELPQGSQRATPQAESTAPPAEERRSHSVVSARHVSLPMSPRFLEAQMEVAGDETAPEQSGRRSPSASASASASLSAIPSHHGLPMSPRFLELQMDIVADGNVDAQEGERTKSVVVAEPLSVDPPLQPKNGDLAEEVHPLVHSDAPDAPEGDAVATVAASVDPDVPIVTSSVQPVSTDEMPNVSAGGDDDGAEQALILVPQEESMNVQPVEEAVSPQELAQPDDGAAMDVDLPERSLDAGEPTGEPEDAALLELETQPMDVDVNAGEGGDSEGVVSPMLEDGEEIGGDTLDGAPLEPAVAEEEEGEVRVIPHSINVPTDSTTALDSSHEDEDNVTRVSESASENAPSTPDKQQELQSEDVDDDQTQDVPEEPVSVRDVQDETAITTSASTSSANASEPSSVPSKALPGLSRDDQSTPVNGHEPDYTSQPPSIVSQGDLSEQCRSDQHNSASDNVDLSEPSRDDQSIPVNEADQNGQPSSTSSNVDPSPQSPRDSNENDHLPVVQHDSASNDLGLHGRQDSLSEPSAEPSALNLVVMAEEDQKDDSGGWGTSVDPPFVSIDKDASADATSVSHSDKAGLDETLASIENKQHQDNNDASSDVHLNSVYISNPTASMDTTDNVPVEVVNLPIGDPTSVSDGHVVRPMFRPGVTILGILPGNEESAKATSRFVLQNGTEALLTQWRSRYKTQTDITNAASVSLACYRSKDMAETLSLIGTSPDAASEFVNSCPQTWPTDGSLSFGMFYNGKRQFIPLAPPLLPTHDQFLDVSQFVHEGDNTFELEFEPSAKVYTCILFAHHPTQTQLADVAARRKSKAQWTQQLSSCFRPLEIPTLVF